MSDDYDREPLYQYTPTYTKASLYYESRVVHPKVLGYPIPEILSEFRVWVHTHPPTRGSSPNGETHLKPVRFHGWVRVGGSGGWG